MILILKWENNSSDKKIRALNGCIYRFFETILHNFSKIDKFYLISGAQTLAPLIKSLCRVYVCMYVTEFTAKTVRDSQKRFSHSDSGHSRIDVNFFLRILGSGIQDPVNPTKTDIGNIILKILRKIHRIQKYMSHSSILSFGILVSRIR